MAEAPLIPNRDSETRPPQRVRFGLFEADLESRELRKSGIRVKLHGQPFAVLTMLLERAGRVVSREELQQRLWASETFVDFEHGLNKAINKLRDALGDSAENPRFVETVPRLGYRFIAPITGAEQPKAPAALVVMPSHSAAGAAGVEPSSEPDLADDVVQTRRRSRFVVVLAGALLTLALIASGLLFRERLNAPPGAMSLNSIAVLPFADLSPQKDQGYFADGITVALISDLARIEDLRTISRTSVMRYKDASRPIREIAAELGVDAVVEGAVLAGGDQVRVSVNLVDGRTDQTLWSRQYEREIRDVLALQREVATSIANGIRIRTAAEAVAAPRELPQVDPEAYRYYLKGLQARYRDLPDTWHEAVGWFEKAVARDPSFAPAHVGLAIAYTLTGGFTNYIPVDEGERKAEQAIRRALELDPNLAEVHLANGLFQYVYRWNWVEAERSFRRSIELNSGLSDAHYDYGWLLMRMGRYDEAHREMKEALRLDPRAAYMYWALSQIYYADGQYDAALNEIRNSLDLDPGNAFTIAAEAAIYLEKGDPEKTIAILKDSEPLRVTPWAPSHLAVAYAHTGRQAELAQLLRDMEKTVEKDPRFGSWSLAVAYAGLRRPAEACRWLKASLDRRPGDAVYIKVDPLLRRLGADPCYQEAIRRVGLQ